MSKTLARKRPITRRRTVAALLSLSFFNLVACTSYVPVRGSLDTAAHQAVRVTLTDQGRMDVGPRLGLRATRLEGVLEAITDSSLTLSVRKVSREGGIEDIYAGEELYLPARDFEIVERSKVSVSRSVLAAGALVVSALLIGRGAGDVSGGKTGGPPPPAN